MTEFLPPANSKVLIEAGGKKEIDYTNIYMRLLVRSIVNNIFKLIN